VIEINNPDNILQQSSSLMESSNGNSSNMNPQYYPPDNSQEMKQEVNLSAQQIQQNSEFSSKI